MFSTGPLFWKLRWEGGIFVISLVKLWNPCIVLWNCYFRLWSLAGRRSDRHFQWMDLLVPNPSDPNHYISHAQVRENIDKKGLTLDQLKAFILITRKDSDNEKESVDVPKKLDAGRTCNATKVMATINCNSCGTRPWVVYLDHSIKRVDGPRPKQTTAGCPDGLIGEWVHLWRHNQRRRWFLSEEAALLQRLRWIVLLQSNYWSDGRSCRDRRCLFHLLREQILCQWGSRLWRIVLCNNQYWFYWCEGQQNNKIVELLVSSSNVTVCEISIIIYYVLTCWYFVPHATH